ncbi:MAG TPA: OsmC family protein [Polyangiaceae bacterium]|jgi:uncharacterized OsmC-like protein|nr:OsmC family protein [Polyangiaceae bacterium]
MLPFAPMDYEWSVRVAATSHERANAFVRGQRLEIGPPLAFDSELGATTAFEYLLAALGADLTVGLRATARRKRLDVDGVEAVVRAELDNPAVYLGVVGEEGSPALARVRVKVYVSTLEEEDTVREAWEQTLARSPLYQTLRAAVAIDLDIKIAI